MRNVVEGVTYFLVGGSIILLILIFFVRFRSQVFDFDQPERAATTASSAAADATDDPDFIITATTTEPGPNFDVPALNPNVRPGESITYDGDLELPVNGATGYAAVDTDVYNNDVSSVIAVLKPGDAFVILRESGHWWQINSGGGSVIGWVRHNHCMINLPDVIPSVIYNNTNAYSSVFRANEESIPDITGERLYSYSTRRDGKAMNERLQRHEYIVPVLYATAKRIYLAQINARANGDTLIIYEAFRPADAQRKVYSAVNALPGSQKNFGGWSQSMFIAGGTSNHQVGYAIDASLAKVINSEYLTTGKYIYEKLDYFEYAMPSMIHELSVLSVVYARSGSSAFSEGMSGSEPAQNLQKYCVDAGLSTLPSEWWHFNDEYANNELTKKSTGNFTITECLSVAPN